VTYARMKAHEAQNRWLNGPGGHAAALEAVEAVINEVIEQCAPEAEPACGETCFHPDHDGSRMSAARIRAVLIRHLVETATPPGTEE
jgi:hypothetical protein